MLHVCDHANDLRPGRFWIEAVQTFAESLFARKKTPSHRLVDHHRRRSAVAIVCVKSAPGAYLHSHCAEVIGADGVQLNYRFFSTLPPWTSLDVDHAAPGQPC